jgi:eukaryotic-like serine/threonine-protein kinase
MAVDPRSRRVEGAPAETIPISEEATATEGDWPVAPELAPALVQEASRSGEERAELVVEHPRRGPGPRLWRGSLLLVLVFLVLLLGAALLWVIAHNRGKPGSAADTSGKSSAATPAAKGAVPRVLGLQLASAKQLLTSRGLTVDVRQTPSSRARGTVLAQSPGAGAHVRQGASVLLVVAGAKGTVAAKPKVTVPRVVGLSVTEATSRLRAAGLEADIHSRPSSEPAGTVTGQNPASADHVARGTSVRLDVARSKTPNATGAGAPAKPKPKPNPTPAKVLMPRLVGLQSTAAVTRLRGLGLHATLERTASSEAPGTVLAQSAVAGAQMRHGMSVVLRVSSGPAAVDVPDTTGLSESSARQQLTGAGFQVDSVDQSVSDPSQDGMVVDQTPAGGTSAHKGDTITITVGRATS